MANLNINRDVSDVFYRYKMPRLIAKVEGKGNGIKTVLVNMVDIAKALGRPATYPTKYFGCELGAQTQFDLKNDRFIVNGGHDAAKLQDLLDGFIRKFVLCPECSNPETILTVQARKGTILSRCAACGHQANLDMRHKLTTFILKNPPPTAIQTQTQEGERTAVSEKADDKKTSSKKKDKKSHENGDISPEIKDTPEKSANHKATPDKSSLNHKKKGRQEDDDDDWGEDTSEDAVRQRMQQLTDAAKNMMHSDDLDKPILDRVNIFYDFVKGKRSELKDGKFPASVQKELVTEAERLELKDQACCVLVELLFDTNILTQIKDHKQLFRQFTAGNARAQKYVLGSIEKLVGIVHHDALIAKVPHIIKALYDADILDEEVILDWDTKGSKEPVFKEIHDRASPFVKWLREADEETSEEDEELEVVYSHSEKVGTHVVPKAAPPAVSQADEGEDIDIEAI